MGSAASLQDATPAQIKAGYNTLSEEDMQALCVRISLHVASCDTCAGLELESNQAFRRSRRKSGKHLG